VIVLARDAINKIKLAENEASAEIKRALERAKKALTEADQEAGRRAAAILAEARETGEDIVESARREAFAEGARIEDAADREIANALSYNEEGLNEIAELIAERIVKGDVGS
jgi:vacuolar-type H+-ATPase subunit H